MWEAEGGGAWMRMCVSLYVWGGGVGRFLELKVHKVGGSFTLTHDNMHSFYKLVI